MTVKRKFMWSGWPNTWGEREEVSSRKNNQFRDQERD